MGSWYACGGWDLTHGRHRSPRDDTDSRTTGLSGLFLAVGFLATKAVLVHTAIMKLVSPLHQARYSFVRCRHYSLIVERRLCRAMASHSPALKLFTRRPRTPEHKSPFLKISPARTAIALLLNTESPLP